MTNICIICKKETDENQLKCNKCKEEYEIEQFIASIEAEFGLNQ